MSQKTLRIGIIGVGGMGGHHLRTLMGGEIPSAQAFAICDNRPERIVKWKEEFGEKLRYFEDPDAFFASGLFDAVIIATPHYDHPPLAIKGFEHGKHVLVEKPAGVYTKQVREMNAAAARSGKVFAIMFNQRTLGFHQKMRDLVQSGELGELRRTEYVITNWLRSQAYYDSGGWRGTWGGEGGGVLMNQCPHNLDLFQWICGMPSRVRAFCGFGKHHHIEVEDDVTAYLEYANGATGVFITSTGEAPGVNRLEVIGDHGRLVLEHGKITWFRVRTPVGKLIRETEESFPHPEVWNVDIPASGGEQHKGILKNWTAAILEGKPLLAKGEEGINGLMLGNAMLLSAWTDGWVDVPVDEDLYYAKLQERIATSTFKKGEVRKSSGAGLEGSFGGVR